MKTILVRISLVVLVLFVLALIALVSALVWPGLVFGQTIAVYPPSLAAESTKSEYLAWLEVEKKDGVTSIDLVCENLTDRDATLSYSLLIEKVSPEGKFSSRQSSTVRIKAGQKSVIARAGVFVPAGGFWKVRMAVYKDGNLVAEDERIYGGQEI